MNHLPSASGEYPDIPFILTEPYDNQGFFDFPTRKGYNKQALLTRGDVGNHSTEDFTSFIQSWLFFGLLCEAFDSTWEIVLEKFVRINDAGRKCVDTRRLPEFFASWRSTQGTGSIDAARRIKIELVLTEAKTAVSKFCSTIEVGWEPLWPIDSRIAMSLMILGESVTWAKNKLLLRSSEESIGWISDDFSGWGPSGFLLGRMAFSGWCPYSIRMLNGSMRGSVSALFYTT
jgi:hypothetical protein